MPSEKSQGITVAPVMAELKPAGVAHRVGEALAPLAVVQVGDGARSELASQAAGGVPQGGLFGGMAGIHEARTTLLADESQVAKGGGGPIIHPSPARRDPCLANETTTP